LILGRWADAVSHGEVAEEGPDFVGSHLVRMPHAVVEDEPSDPVDVRLFRARAVVKGPDGPPNPIEGPTPYRTAGGREGARSECKSPGGGLEYRRGESLEGGRSRQTPDRLERSERKSAGGGHEYWRRENLQRARSGKTPDRLEHGAPSERKNPGG